jgi:hypothetical protein
MKPPEILLSGKALVYILVNIGTPYIQTNIALQPTKRSFVSRFPLRLLSLAALALPAVAHAEPAPATQCGKSQAPTGALAPWTAPEPLKAAGEAAQLPQAALAAGQAVRLTLLRTSDIRYPLRPEKPGGSVSYGGLIGLTITEPGTFRVALDSAAWIDMVKDGEAIASTRHGHGPDCTGIRKMVDFPLQPGSYTLQIAANGAPELHLLVARLP